MANKPIDFPMFSGVDENTYHEMGEKIIGYLKREKLSRFLNIDTKEIILSEETLRNVIDYVERRRVFYHIFFSGHRMSELTEGAILCYGIAKLRPFFHICVDKKLLNVKIGLCLLTGAVHYYYEKTKQKYFVSEQILNYIFNTLMSETISEDSLINLVESFFKENK